MTIDNKNSWRSFQLDYILEKKRKDRLLKVGKLTIFLLGLSLAAAALIIGFRSDFFSDIRPGTRQAPASTDLPETESIPSEKPFLLSKAELAPIIDPVEILQSDKNIFFVDTLEHSYKITTSIDVYLQEYLLRVISRLKRLDRGKPQRIAFVVMEADTGKILAMTGFDLENKKANPCFESDYPAASIFKIITAAAAIEKLGYTPATRLYFNGKKYTLYKRQLRDVKNKYTYQISFSQAFAESINPVFGKIGKNRLGKQALESYASAFGFNQDIRSELDFFTGSFATTESEYHLAELGCGFNTDTTISPIFGAMLTAGIINQGEVMIPSLVEHVTDAEGKVIYKNQKETYKTAIGPETASALVTLMQRTVSSGTAKKTFRRANRDSILSTLLIGGKTGSLYNREHTVKYDWFTGFAKQKKTGRSISMAIVVGHRKYMGTRATTYAKMILKQYFKPHDRTAQN